MKHLPLLSLLVHIKDRSAATAYIAHFLLMAAPILYHPSLHPSLPFSALDLSRAGTGAKYSAFPNLLMSCGLMLFFEIQEFCRGLDDCCATPVKFI